MLQRKKKIPIVCVVFYTTSALSNKHVVSNFKTYKTYNDDKDDVAIVINE